jgi:hypothetical protein
LTAALVAACGASMLASPAMAQPGGKKKNAEVRAEPPTPKKSDRPPTLWNYLILIVVLGAVFGANVIPSKRGHQD